VLYDWQQKLVHYKEKQSWTAEVAEEQVVTIDPKWGWEVGGWVGGSRNEYGGCLRVSNFASFSSVIETTCCLDNVCDWDWKINVVAWGRWWLTFDPPNFWSCNRANLYHVQNSGKQLYLCKRSTISTYFMVEFGYLSELEGFGQFKNSFEHVNMAYLWISNCGPNTLPLETKYIVWLVLLSTYYYLLLQSIYRFTTISLKKT